MGSLIGGLPLSVAAAQASGGAAAAAAAAAGPTLVETVSLNYEDFSESFLTCGTCLCPFDGQVSDDDDDDDDDGDDGDGK